MCRGEAARGRVEESTRDQREATGVASEGGEPEEPRDAPCARSTGERRGRCGSEREPLVGCALVGFMLRRPSSVHTLSLRFFEPFLSLPSTIPNPLALSLFVTANIKSSSSRPRHSRRNANDFNLFSYVSRPSDSYSSASPSQDSYSYSSPSPSHSLSHTYPPPWNTPDRPSPHLCSYTRPACTHLDTPLHLCSSPSPPPSRTSVPSFESPSPPVRYSEEENAVDRRPFEEESEVDRRGDEVEKWRDEVGSRCLEILRALLR
jgi:hypothetical protein